MDDPPEVFRGTGGRSVLQRIVRAHIDDFLTEFEDEHGGRALPQYVLSEFQSLLECGDPAFGFCRLRCPSCATDMVLPISCKRRTLCPSCGGRQMAQAAAHLVDRVFPDVPVRQWVLSVPKPLRLTMAMDANLCRDVTRAHIRAVSASYVRRAKASHADDRKSQVEQAPIHGKNDTGDEPRHSVQFHPGAVNAAQRFGSSLELNVHFHSLYLDGVYATRGPFDPPVFMPAPQLTSSEVHRVHGDAIVRIRRVLESFDLAPLALGLPPKRGNEAQADLIDASANEHPLLDFGDAREGSLFPTLKAASVDSLVPLGPRAGRPLTRLKDPHLAQAFEAAGWPRRRVPNPLVVNANGFSLHAATRVTEGERDRLEKLCRYVTRPALCLKRLAVRSDGQISWSLRKPWRDGTRAFLMGPHEFLARLAAIVPHPREHQLTYQGVLAPASPLRDQVAPRPVVAKEPGEREEGPDAIEADPDNSGGPPTPLTCQRYIPWAELLKRVFGVDILRCPRCRGQRHMISVITDPETVRKVLAGVREAAKRRDTLPSGGLVSTSAGCRSPPGSRDPSHSNPHAASPRATGLRVGKAEESARGAKRTVALDKASRASTLGEGAGSGSWRKGALVASDGCACVRGQVE